VARNTSFVQLRCRFSHGIVRVNYTLPTGLFVICEVNAYMLHDRVTVRI